MAFDRGAAPPGEEPEPLVERRAISAGFIIRTRAAANSIARGIPSRRRQICTIASTLSAVTAKSCAAAAARRRVAPRRFLWPSSPADTPSEGSASERKAMIRSPLTPSPSRLVARTRTPGHDRQRLDDLRRRVEHVLTVVEHQHELPVRGRSQTTSTSSTGPAAAAPRAPATTDATLGSPVRASSAIHAPPGNAANARPRPAMRDGSCPRRRRRSGSTDDGLQRVPSARCQLTRHARRTRCAAAGRLPGTSRANATAGTPRQPRRLNWNTCIAAARSRRRCSPRSTISTSPGRVTDQLFRHLRHQHLPAVRHRHEPRRAVEHRAVVVAVAQFGGAGVQTHPYPERADLDPRFAAQRELPRRARPDGGVSRVEHGVKPVTRRLHDVAAVRLDRVPDQLVVARQRRTASRPDAPPTNASNPRHR